MIDFIELLSLNLHDIIFDSVGLFKSIDSTQKIFLDFVHSLNDVSTKAFNALREVLGILVEIIFWNNANDVLLALESLLWID